MVCCFRTWIFGVSWFVLISYFPTSLVCFTFIFVSFLLCSPHLSASPFLAKMRISTFNIHCWSCLLFLLGRDSSVIKEEIKAFLANRRISQAVVAQALCKSWRAFILEFAQSRLLVQMLEYCLHFCIAVRSVNLGIIMYACDLKPIVSGYLGTSPVIFFFIFSTHFTAFVKSTKLPILWLKRILSGFLVIVTELMTHAHSTAYISYF